MRQLGKAAHQGDARSQIELAQMYVKGQGVPQDDEVALHWLRKAAAQRNWLAQHDLRNLRCRIEATKKAEQGDAEAQIELYIRYSFGLSVPEDHDEALGWLRRAAAQGHPEAKKWLSGSQSAMSTGTEIRLPILKTFAVAILSSFVYWPLFLLGAVLLSIKNATGSEGDGVTIGRLIQDGAVSGMATYGVLRLPSMFFSNLRPRLLIASFLVLLVVVYVGLFLFDFNYFGPQGRIVALRASLFSDVLSFAAAVVGGVIYLRRESVGPASP